VPPRASREAAAKPAPPRVLWQPAFCGKPAQLPHGLPTDMLDKYADITVSPTVTEAARRITAPHARASGV
jgi:hypothetical protein